MRKPAIDRADSVAKQQTLIQAAKDASDAQFLEDAFRSTRRRLLPTMERVLREVADKRFAGELTRGKVRRAVRLSDLLAELEAELSVFGSTAYRRVLASKRTARNDSLEGSRVQVGIVTGQTPARITTELTDAVLRRMGDGSPLAAHFQQFGPEVAQKAINTITTGIFRGRRVDHIAGDLEDVLDVPRWRAILIAKTEVNTVKRAAAIETYAAAGIPGWIWRCLRTRNTCVMCLAMDGQYFDAGTGQWTHPACRCYSVPAVEAGLSSRRETAQHWFDRQPAAVQLEAIGTKSGYALYQSGAVTLQDFVRNTESARFGPGRDVKPVYQLVQDAGNIGRIA